MQMKSLPARFSDWWISLWMMRTRKAAHVQFVCKIIPPSVLRERSHDENLQSALLGICWGVGCTVVWWLAPLPHSERVPSSIPTCGLSVWSLHVLPVYAWVLSGYSSSSHRPKTLNVRLIGVSKIVLRSECERVWLFVLFGPVMDWWPIKGVPHLSPDDRWDRLQAPRDPTDGLSG